MANQNKELIEAINDLTRAVYDVSSEIQLLKPYLKSDIHGNTVADSLEIIGNSLAEYVFNKPKKES